MAPLRPRVLRALQLGRSGPSIPRLASPRLLASLDARRAAHSTTNPGSTLNPSPNPNPSYSSVSADEVAHFNALASSWWDPHGPSRLLHLMNPLRHDFIRACRASQPASASAAGRSTGGLRYLDVGCGGGIFAESAARLPGTASVTGLDPSRDVLAVARAHARRDPALAPPRLTYQEGTIENLGLPKDDRERYDVVSVFEVLEHVEAPGEFLDRCAPFVRPGGWLVASTIARTWLSWFTTNFMAEDVLGIVPRGTHDWHKYINEEELRGYLLGKKGWSSPRCMGVVYVPGLGWREVTGSERVGNYFFAVRRDD